MAISIPTTQQLIDTFTSAFEAKLGQTVPALERSFISVLSRVLALSDTGLYKYAANRILQSLAITATGDNLDLIGDNYGVYRIAGTAAEINVTLLGTTGSTLPQTADFVADNSGVRYYPETDVAFDNAPTAGQETFTIISESIGTTGNAVSGDTFTLASPVPGLAPVATYSSSEALGQDRETDPAYRRRILDEIRTVGGSGNGVDYRRWGEQSSNVARIYPYSGKPVDGSEGLTDEPGDRTIYVEATTAYLTGDRTADTALLAEVRSLITTDPDTSLERVPLGCPDNTLFVKSIANQDIWVTITSLTANGTTSLADIKIDVEQALSDYLLELTPYVEGVDVEVDRDDVITGLSIARIVQQILIDLSGTATAITFSLTESGSSAGSYTVPQGYLPQLGGVDYD
jgi:hypothetical protein